MRKLFVLFACLVCAAPVSAQAVPEPPAIPSDLTDYVKRAEPDYAWKLVEKSEADGNIVYQLHVVSQKWHDELWEHDLIVFLPKETQDKSGIVLFNTGGSAKGNATINVLGLELARRMKSPVAFLFGIPKQPLYDGKKEDALIAETFVRYLETGDGSWPLLFPMVKSVVKAMDTLQAFGKKEWTTDVNRFVVTGASKRGWTSWLTAATTDPRVVGIAPMVIDTLNFQKQMPNQLKSFGRFSEMIHDYEERKLLPLPDTAAARKLWAMVDPWVYRSRLTLPKMIINGTNDPYWTQDALNQYWDDLPGEKWILYVPNAGHDLRPQEKPNEKGSKKDTFPMKAVDGLAAFSRSVLGKTPFPKVTATPAVDDDNAVIKVSVSVGAKDVKVWTTTAETRDFRRSVWTSSDAVIANRKEPPDYRVTVPRPSSGYKAAFVELSYELDGLKYHLSTPITIQEAKK